MEATDDPIVVPLPQGERILNGFDLGRSMRTALGLDAQDRVNAPVELLFDTPVVTSTFIRGLLGPSVEALGYEGFAEKYHVRASSDVRENILATAQVVDKDKTAT